MIKLLTMGVIVATLGACATPPPPICDRSAQVWNKFETQEDMCAEPVVEAPTLTKTSSEGSNSSTESVEVVEPTTPTPEPVQPSPEEETETTPDTPVVRGNPGNDKAVGRAGEQDKDVGSSGGTRGASTGKN